MTRAEWERLRVAAYLAAQRMNNDYGPARPPVSRLPQPKPVPLDWVTLTVGGDSVGHCEGDPDSPEFAEELGKLMDDDKGTPPGLPIL